MDFKDFPGLVFIELTKFTRTQQEVANAVKTLLKIYKREYCIELYHSPVGVPTAEPPGVLSWGVTKSADFIGVPTAG